MDKDRQDALIFLSQTHRALHERRIQRSFRIVISTLTLLGICVAAKFAADSNWPKDDMLFDFLVWVVFLGIWWLVLKDFSSSRDANNINQTIAQDAEDLIIDDLKISKPKQNPRQKVWLWETMVVSLGVFASAFVLTVDHGRLYVPTFFSVETIDFQIGWIWLTRRRVGIILVVLGTLLLARSTKVKRQYEGEMAKVVDEKKDEKGLVELTEAYIVQSWFWSGLFLIAIGSFVQW
jgi:hypothetical protein